MPFDPARDPEAEYAMTHCRVCGNEKDKGEEFCGDRECINKETETGEDDQ